MKNYLLDNGFYKILKSDSAREESSCVASIELNEKHPIFGSHFEGLPVTPGVCICQIAQELIQILVSKSIRLVVGKNIKFIEIINPEVAKIIRFEIKYALDQEDNLTAQVIVKNDESVFSKLSLNFVVAHE